MANWVKPMKKKTVYVFTVPGIAAIGLITTLLLTGCGTAPTPKGSVLEQKADFLHEKQIGNYTAFQITARVQNIGEDGVVAVLAEVLPVGSVPDGQNRKTTEVYLRKGEEKQLIFDFWVWYNTEVRFGVRAWPR